MRTTAIIAGALLLGANTCQADDGDDTLRFYLSKSDLIVLGSIVSQPVALLGEKGVPNYFCEFKISDVCKGDAQLRDQAIHVNIKRFEIDRKDHHPLIKNDAECILFLKKGHDGHTPHWVTADVWFGIQHPLPWMLKSLKRLAKEKKGYVEQAHSAEPVQPSAP